MIAYVGIRAMQEAFEIKPRHHRSSCSVETCNEIPRNRYGDGHVQ